MNQQKEKSADHIVKVYNLIILDQSGSMEAIYQEALTGVNETLHTIRMAKADYPEQEHFVTLVAFDGIHHAGLRYNAIYDAEAAEKVVDITKEQYCPYGNTPLFDAMGKAITELREKAQNDDIALVTIITDGYENASKEFTGPAIKALIEEQRKKGWVFTYIGANQDVDRIAESMAINNRMAFVSDSEGTKAMFDKECMARKRFFGKARLRWSNSISRDELESNYFENQ